MQKVKELLVKAMIFVLWIGKVVGGWILSVTTFFMLFIPLKALGGFYSICGVKGYEYSYKGIRKIVGDLVTSIMIPTPKFLDKLGYVFVRPMIGLLATESTQNATVMYANYFKTLKNKQSLSLDVDSLETTINNFKLYNSVLYIIAFALYSTMGGLLIGLGNMMSGSMLVMGFVSGFHFSIWGLFMFILAQLPKILGTLMLGSAIHLVIVYFKKMMTLEGLQEYILDGTKHTRAILSKENKELEAQATEALIYSFSNAENINGYIEVLEPVKSIEFTNPLTVKKDLIEMKEDIK